MNPDSVILTEIIDLKMTIIQQRDEIMRMRQQIDAMKPQPDRKAIKPNSGDFIHDEAMHVDDRRPG